MYREIDNIIYKMNFEIFEMEEKYLNIFKKYEDEIIYYDNILEIIQKIEKLWKLLDFNDVCFVFNYKFRYFEFI